MGDCIYCGHQVGILRDKHPECEQQHKNLYLASSQKSFQVPYAKIVAFGQIQDGIGIMRDTASAKPQIFVTQEGWFTCNLITMLAQQ